MSESLTGQLLRWSPRGVAILYAAFLTLFAFDVFESGSALEQVVGFLIHLAPVYAVVLALIFAWRWPRLGGVLFLALAVGFAFAFGWREMGILVLMAGPLVVAGVLFLASGWGGRARLRPRF